MPLRAYDEVAVGDQLAPQTYPVRRADLIRYAGASGDFNPIHWDERFALSVGLPDVIAHGMFTMALVGRFVTTWAGDPGAVVDFGVRFTKAVEVPYEDGGSVQVMGVVAGLDGVARSARIDFTVTSGDDKVLTGARATVRLA